MQHNPFDRDPWMLAEDRFTKGEITRVHAIGLVASDTDFVAECELTGRNVSEAARMVVEGPWTIRLWHHMIGRITE